MTATSIGILTTVLAISMSVLFSYPLGAEWVRDWGFGQTMAVPTAFCLFLLAAERLMCHGKEIMK